MRIRILIIFSVLSIQLFSQYPKKKEFTTMNGIKYGFVDDTGKVLIKPKYDKVSDFNHGYSFITDNEFLGVIDTLGNLIIPAIYKYISFCNVDFDNRNNDLFIASVDEKNYGYINNAGNVIIPFEYNDVGSFTNNGLAFAEINGKCGFINRKNEIIIPLNYFKANNFCNGIAFVCKNRVETNKVLNIITDYWGCINSKGEEISSMDNLSESENLCNGYAVVISSIDKRISLIDSNGNIIIKNDDFKSIQEMGKFLIVKNSKNKCGIYDYRGKKILPVIFSSFRTEEDKNGNLISRRAYFNEHEIDAYFYVDENFKCIEYKGVKCPEY